MSRRSKIEVKGWGARHYDLIMYLLLLGRCQSLIEEAIEGMDIRRGTRSWIWRPARGATCV